ncbi:MAG: hypothetical protein HS111_06455 [Kofleriaceae bacterium]|nr:hypothetical protein [Kofleriaceae bacterium]
MTMKMSISASATSTNGVTLMSADRLLVTVLAQAAAGHQPPPPPAAVDAGQDGVGQLVGAAQRTSYPPAEVVEGDHGRA